jgi:glycosyltransferase involved in cell wall biosynthesis
MAKIAVLMLTRNSERYIDEVLIPIRNQRDKHEVKLVVVDGFSNDNTQERIRHYFLDAIIIEDSSRNLAHLRNVALEKAKSLNVDYISFIDSDVVVPENFFDRMLHLLDDKKVGIVGLRLELEKDPPKHFIPKFYRNRTDIVRQGILTTDYTTTACSMWKAYLSNSVVLDERLKRAGEDVDFNLQITGQGFKALIDANDPPAWHIRIPTIREELHRVKDHGLARALLLNIHSKSIYRSRRYKTLLAAFFVACGWIGLILVPWIGLLGLIPFAGLFFRQWTKTKQKWRIDYAFFGFLMSLIYFTRFLQGVFMYWI